MVATPIGRRTGAVLIVAVLLALPAGVMRVLCIGNACHERAPAPDVPFCSLPSAARRLISAGYREGRSPEVITVTSTALETRVWLRIAAPGIQGEAADGISLDRVAPTIARLIGLRRPHPEVRSGRPLGLSIPQRPRLVAVIVFRGKTGSEAPMPRLERRLGDAVISVRATTGSYPADPVATLATLGTGGLPRQHGITGGRIRADSGKLVDPAGPGAPVSIIATLADDLDELGGDEPEIGLVAGDPRDRVVVGGDWYLDGDRDRISIVPPAKGAAAARSMLADRFGRGKDVDLFVAVLEGEPTSLDQKAAAVVAAARAADPRALVVVTGTGSPPAGYPSRKVARAVERTLGAPVVAAARPGGLFLDQDVLAREGISTRAVVRALEPMADATGNPLFADVFSSTAVEFGRYC